MHAPSDYTQSDFYRKQTTLRIAQALDDIEHDRPLDSETLAFLTKDCDGKMVLPEKVQFFLDRQCRSSRDDLEDS